MIETMFAWLAVHKFAVGVMAIIAMIISEGHLIAFFFLLFFFTFLVWCFT